MPGGQPHDPRSCPIVGLGGHHSLTLTYPRISQGYLQLVKKAKGHRPDQNLQVVLNFFLSKIETLNDNLVEYLLTRDELAIEQDSLLTDIEDITKCISSANS